MTRTPANTLLLAAEEKDQRKISQAINSAINGKINSVGTVTLAANVATTTVNNALVGLTSVILLMPQTANASAEVGAGTIYIKPSDIVRGASFKITHANNAQTDRVFSFCILG